MWQKCKTFVCGVMARSNRLIEIVGGRRHRESEARDLDAVPPHPLIPRGEHPRIVLLGRDDLVAGLQVDAVLRDLERLARVARDREFLGIAPDLRGQHARIRSKLRPIMPP